MAETLRATITLSEADLAAFAQWYYRATAVGRRRMRVLRVVGMIAILAYFYATPPERSAEGAIGTLIAAALLFFAYNFALWYLPPQMARWSLRIGPRRVLLEPIRYCFSPDGIEIETDKGRGRADWSVVQELAQTDGHIFLRLEGMNAFILPKTQLENWEAAAMLLEKFRNAAGREP